MAQVRYKRVLGKFLQNDRNDSTKYYIYDYKSAISVNEIGARIFELCDGSNDSEKICEKLQLIYDVDMETLMSDVLEFLPILTENKVIREV